MNFVLSCFCILEQYKLRLNIIQKVYKVLQRSLRIYYTLRILLGYMTILLG